MVKAQWREYLVNSLLGAGEGQKSRNAHKIRKLEEKLLE